MHSSSQTNQATITTISPCLRLFIVIVFREIATLNQLKAWTVFAKSTDMIVLPSTWAFKIKQFSRGLVKKLKSRICMAGNKQTDIDSFKYLSLVVAYLIVRTMSILSVLLGLKSVLVDFMSAFCRARVKEDTYYISQQRGQKACNRMCLKELIEVEKIMILNQCLCSLKQIPKSYSTHLKECLESIGFSKSKGNHYLFLKGIITCLVYIGN